MLILLASSKNQTMISLSFFCCCCFYFFSFCPNLNYISHLLLLGSVCSYVSSSLRCIIKSLRFSLMFRWDSTVLQTFVFRTVFTVSRGFGILCCHFHLVLGILVLLLDLFSGSFSVQVWCLIFIAGALHAVFLLGMATFIPLW